MMRSIRFFGVGAVFAVLASLAQGMSNGSTGGTGGSGGTGTFTPLAPSPDSRLIYVSASMGNDANSGLSASAPKATIGEGLKLLRNGYPDWLMLKAGDVFHDNIEGIFASGRSETQPVVITSYGSGNRPLLLTGCSSGVSIWGPDALDHVAIVGLNFIAHKWRGSSAEFPSGVGCIRPGTDLLIEDCRFENYANSVLIQGYPTVRTNTKIRRNVMVDPVRLDPNAGATNIFMDQFDGVLVEENLLEHSMASEARGAYVSHNIYLHEDNPSAGVVVRGNIATNGGRSNFNIRTGGLVEDNLSIRGAIGINIGIYYAQTFASGTVQNNVIIASRDNQNGQSLGVGLYIFKSDGLTVANNIISQNSGGTHPEAFNIDGTVGSLTLDGNIVWRWMGLTQPAWGVETLHVDGTPSGIVTVRNNQIQQLGNALLISLTGGSYPNWHFSFAGNKYYSMRPNQWWFGPGTISTTPSQWQQMFGDAGMTLGALSYVDPDRSVATYMSSMGGAASDDAFVAQARLQSKANWRPEYTASAANAFVRAGFAVGTPACVADVDRNGTTTPADVDLLRDMIARGDWAGDLNRDGMLTASDYTVWLNAFRSGCP